MSVEIPNPSKSLEALQSTLPSEAMAVSVYLAKAAARPSDRSVRRLQMSAKLAERVKFGISASIATLVGDALEDADGVKDFSFRTFADGRLAHLPIGQIAQVEDWTKQIPMADGPRPFGGDRVFLKSIKFTYSVFTYASGELLVTFRRASETRIMRPGLIAAIFDISGVYEEVKSDSIIAVDDSVDFFIWREMFFIKDYNAFETAINMKSITQSMADTAFSTVLAALPVSKPQEVRNLVFASKRYMRRMAGLGTKPHVKLLDMTKISKLITDEGLDIPIVDVNGVITLDVDPTSKTQMQSYMRILSDSYVRSMLTELKYILNEGDPM